MLTAWHRATERIVALPDLEGRADVMALRDRTRAGDYVCPTCRQLLWLHAGPRVVWHFAHRSLSDCPQGRVSEAVLAARRSIYRFFQTRIQSGKLPGRIELEPPLSDFPRGSSVDLLLHRSGKPAIAVLILATGLKPATRADVAAAMAHHEFVFRPVFLASRLKRVTPQSRQFLLDPTQRELLLASPYDRPDRSPRSAPGTLHVLDPKAESWTTARGLRLLHEPQVYEARAVLSSPLLELLWSERHAEWVHPGEAEALNQARQAAAEQRRRQVEKQRLERPPASPPAPNIAASVRPPLPTPPPPPPPVVARMPEPLPAWLQKGLVCIGCGRRTIEWQLARPGQERCICRACFAAGRRWS